MAPQAVTHSLFDALNEDEPHELERSIKRPLPNDLREFYLQCNGLICFVTEFEISGLKKTHARGVKAALSHPFELSIPNLEERPKNAEDDMVFFGSYDYDGSCLYMRADNRVHYAKPGDATPLKTWDCFDVFIERELRRIFSLFSDKGERLVDGAKVLPLDGSSDSEL
ncbi:MAG: SMI1/KNR4 family protein [Deltaproteobacteria bacterium]|nr:SMI1/KNR4 family protein [Deltaproteobacteria bacterium]